VIQTLESSLSTLASTDQQNYNITLLMQPNGLKRPHRPDLPLEHGTHEDPDDYIRCHVSMKSWTEVSKRDPEIRGA
jgi:hypothetical protein